MIDAIKPSSPQIESIKPLQQKTEEGQFGDIFESALKEANQLQLDSEAQVEGLALKKEGVTTHSAMVALEKADIAFQLMSAIRGKIIRAYEEVLRTQV